MDPEQINFEERTADDVDRSRISTLTFILSNVCRRQMLRYGVTCVCECVREPTRRDCVYSSVRIKRRRETALSRNMHIIDKEACCGVNN